MVAVIKFGNSLHKTFNYNENKVNEGVATCIGAANYPKDLADLTLTNKLNRLTNQAALNVVTRRNSVHISLNFHPSETFSSDTLNQIASIYMEKIGMGNQPYLVYKHEDAGHPHIHIVSTLIRENGRRIETQNIGLNKSEPARKSIEIAFGLIKAEDRTRPHGFQLEPVDFKKVQYGKSPTKRAITNVLDRVLNDYKYTSLAELNAVLKKYNVMADRGNENSRVYKNNGLLFRVLDQQGKKVGVPIKASDFYNQPTLNKLTEHFTRNVAKRLPHKNRIKNAINQAILKHHPLTITNLTESLEKMGIDLVLRQNAQGIIYGITYIDHTTKSVFNGSALGPQYSANAIKQKCGISPALSTLKSSSPLPANLKKQDLTAPKTTTIQAGTNAKEYFLDQDPGPGSKLTETFLEALFDPEYTGDYIPGHLRLRTKKKKKKRI